MRDVIAVIVAFFIILAVGLVLTFRAGMELGRIREIERHADEHIQIPGKEIDWIGELRVGDRVAMDNCRVVYVR